MTNSLFSDLSSGPELHSSLTRLGKHNSDSLLGTFWVVSTLHLSYLSKSLIIIVTLSISQYTYSIILHCSKKELYYLTIAYNYILHLLLLWHW